MSTFILDIPRTNERVWRSLGRNVSLETGTLVMRKEAREFLYRQGILDMDEYFRRGQYDWEIDLAPGQFRLRNTHLNDNRGLVLVDFDMPDIKFHNLNLLSRKTQSQVQSPGTLMVRARLPGIEFHEADKAVAAMFKLTFG